MAFCDVFRLIFWHILLFKVVPKHNAEALSSALKHETVVCALWGKYVLDELCSGMCYNTVGQDQG